MISNFMILMLQLWGNKQWEMDFKQVYKRCKKGVERKVRIYKVLYDLYIILFFRFGIMSVGLVQLNYGLRRVIIIIFNFSYKCFMGDILEYDQWWENMRCYIFCLFYLMSQLCFIFYDWCLLFYMDEICKEDGSGG